MNGSIHLHDVLDQMNARDDDDNPIPFQIKWYTFDRKKQTGGNLIELDSAIGVVGKKKGKLIPIPQRKSQVEEKTSKNPNHYINGTMNICHSVAKQIRKLHFRLIVEFNHKKVYW